MKARTLGPLLMMTLGAAIILAPAAGWVGALEVDPCLEAASAAGAADPPVCCENPQAGVVDPDPCVDTTIAETTTTVEATTTTIAATTTTVAATTTVAVALPSTTDIGSGGQGLPATGDTSSTYVVLGGLLLIGGAGLLVVGRGKFDAAAS